MAAIQGDASELERRTPDTEARARPSGLAAPLKLYGDALAPGDLVEVPEQDLPAGSPPWMLGAANWATRSGATAAAKRATITVTVPKAFRP